MEGKALLLSPHVHYQSSLNEILPAQHHLSFHHRPSTLVRSLTVCRHWRLFLLLKKQFSKNSQVFPRSSHWAGSLKCNVYDFRQDLFIRLSWFSFFSFFICVLILEREERNRNIDVREKHQLAASQTCPDRILNPQPRHVPWPGIELATFWFAGQHPTHWATLIRAEDLSISIHSF